MENQEKPLVIAYYLPQFHPFKENDEWWGKGFTEWTNVGKAKPLFRGHYQPKVPADLGYYDLRLPEIRQQQAELAKEAGVSGFCYWHYWFGEGRQLLNEIIDEVVATGKPDFPFCLGWANETWKAKQWNKDGSGDKVLIEQRYGGEDDYRHHFEYVLKIFKDDRYIKIKNCPLFLIYQPQLMPDMQQFISLWNKWAIEAGFNGIYFIARMRQMEEYDKDKWLKMGANAVTIERTYGFEFNQCFPQKIIKRAIRRLFGLPIVEAYKNAMKYFVKDSDADEDFIPCLIPNWDHSPRSKKKALVLTDSDPKYFKKHIDKVFSIVKKKDNKIVFLKSWNEWAEGNYMEPDLKYGKGYINALKEETEKHFGK